MLAQLEHEPRCRYLVWADIAQEVTMPEARIILVLFVSSMPNLIKDLSFRFLYTTNSKSKAVRKVRLFLTQSIQ